MQKSATGIPVFAKLIVSIVLCCGFVCAQAQVPTPPDTTTGKGSLPAGNVIIEGDTNVVIDGDSNVTSGKSGVTGKPAGAEPSATALPDSVPPNKDNAPVANPQTKTKFDYSNHSPVKATWMSAALPSLGQFYNRRYWKPPIIYAGLGVAIYFLIDNQNKFVIARNSLRARLGVPGYGVHAKYQSYDAAQIESDRDFYRTNRDYCIIAVAGIYALNVIDAAVDAHLRTFDVGDDLSMKIRPSFQYASVTTQTGFAPMPGIAWVLKF